LEKYFKFIHRYSDKQHNGKEGKECCHHQTPPQGFTFGVCFTASSSFVSAVDGVNVQALAFRIKPTTGQVIGVLLLSDEFFNMGVKWIISI